MLRVAIIGMGQRGIATMNRLGYIPEVDIVVVCDKREPNIPTQKNGQISASEQGVNNTRKAPLYTANWQEVVSRKDIELVYVCTPWDVHVEIAVEAMKNGKHVAIEVPAAMRVDECELLVRVSRWTGRHCVMLENCCYDTWHLGIRGLCQQHLFGEITHLEGAYIHTIDQKWMHDQRAHHQGNPYPTHGLGPMCQLLSPDDRLDYLMSLSSTNPLTGNNLNDTLIRTQKGVTMLLQYDTSTPRPYNRLQTVCGTLGYAQKYPLPTIQLENYPSTDKNEIAEGQEPSPATLLTGEAAVDFVESHIAPEFKRLIQEGKALGVENVMNYVMDRRLIDGLLAKQAHLDMEVHEAALWSSLTELTERSAVRGGEKVQIPDF